MGLEKDIKSYFGYIEDHLESIKNIESPKFTVVYKKLCYTASIDLLYNLIYPSSSPREKVVKTLKRFAKWKHGYNVSLPYLLRLLSKTPDPSFEKLLIFTKEEISKWSPGELVELNRDMKYEDVKNIWPKNSECKELIDGVSLDRLSHFQLFYTYRNSLVHELSPPAHSFDLKEINNPFYIHNAKLSSDLKIKEEKWMLSYPLIFFEKLSRDIFESIKEYYKSSELNPYDMFITGSYWLEALNKS